MIREVNDERMVLDPDNLMFLYQGISDADNRGDYGICPTKSAFFARSRANNSTLCALLGCHRWQMPRVFFQHRLVSTDWEPECALVFKPGQFVWPGCNFSSGHDLNLNLTRIPK